MVDRQGLEPWTRWLKELCSSRGYGGFRGKVWQLLAVFGGFWVVFVTGEGVFVTDGTI